MVMSLADRITGDASLTVITASDGRRATAPAHFAAGWDQDVVDSMVMQAHRGNVMDRATCAACNVAAIAEGTAR